MNTDIPASPAHKRPHNKPFFIDPHCPECGEDLVLADLLENPDIAEDDIWHDEFMCPGCRDAVYMDWSDEEYESVKNNPGQELIYLEEEE